MVIFLPTKPYGGSNKPLHQKAFWRANITFVNIHATFAQSFFQADQLAVLSAIQAKNRALVKISQRERAQLPMAFCA